MGTWREKVMKAEGNRTIGASQWHGCIWRVLTWIEYQYTITYICITLCNISDYTTTLSPPLILTRWNHSLDKLSSNPKYMSSSLRRQRFKDGRRHSLDKICLGTCIPASSQFRRHMSCEACSTAAWTLFEAHSQAFTSSPSPLSPKPGELSCSHDTNAPLSLHLHSTPQIQTATNNFRQYNTTPLLPLPGPWCGKAQ